jgi:hypothetical protein
MGENLPPGPAKISCRRPSSVYNRAFKTESTLPVGRCISSHNCPRCWSCQSSHHCTYIRRAVDGCAGHSSPRYHFGHMHSLFCQRQLELIAFEPECSLLQPWLMLLLDTSGQFPSNLLQPSIPIFLACFSHSSNPPIWCLSPEPTNIS